MSAEKDVCQICNKQPFKYTCPKCNICYCSVPCYKSPAHLKCSEEFYKDCIQEELTSQVPNSREDMQKIYDILKRIQDADAGIMPESFEDGLDSDDDENANADAEAGDDLHEEAQADSIAQRLQGVDINNAEDVWQHLLPEEQEEFQKLIETGDIFKLLPNYTPWWLETKSENTKIVDITSQNSKEHNSKRPPILPNIPKFTDLCNKEPSPCLHYNLWNIVAAYSSIARFYCGEHLNNPSEATAQLINLSSTLKYGTNFEDVEDAIISVEMEALTTKSGSAAASVITPAIIESRAELQSDARQIMAQRDYKLATLSDILQLLRLTKVTMKGAQGQTDDFQRLFSLCLGSAALDKTKLKQLERKIEFFLSYVLRDSDEDLK